MSRECGVCGDRKTLDNFGIYKYKDQEYHRHQCKKCFTYKNRSKTYGITIEEVKALVSQENCEICNRFLEEEKDRYIDHDHETGEVRGMLCNRCNTCIQIVENGIYLKMIKYLNK